MNKPLFTPEELAEMAAFDAEIDGQEQLTQEDYREAAQRDMEMKDAMRSPKQRKLAAKQRAYYQANREEIAAKRRAYRQANREKWNAYWREYRRRKKAEREVEAHEHD